MDKPAGWTSHDVVSRARRLLGERRIGHAGTLDPAATGVLPLAVGSATRVVEYLATASKTYLADVAFGVETDSHDADGTVTAVTDASGLTAPAVLNALDRFRGDIEQVPPMHAAIKIDGRRLYELARQGHDLVRPARRVTISELELVDWQPGVASLLIDCSKGTYVRAIARDLGRVLGVGAYLANLVRVRTGPFNLCDAVTLQDLAQWDVPEAWPEIAIHPDSVLEQSPALLLDDQGVAAWNHGVAVASDGAPDGLCRAYGPNGTWLGVGAADPAGRRWRPAKVVPSAA